MYSFKNVKYYFSIIICSLSSSSELMAQTITWSQVNPTAVPLSGTAMLILALTLFIVATYLKKYPHVVRSFVFIMTMFSGVFLIGSGMLNNIAVAFSSIISINSPSGTKHLSRNGVTQVVNNYSSPIRITGLDPEDCSVIRNECNTGLVLEKNDSCEVSLSCGNELIEADFEKQVYIKKEQAGEDSGTALTFLDTGVLRNYDNDGEGSNTWSIASGKLKIGNDISLALKSKTDNKYTFTITEPSGTFETDFFRAKPLSIFDLNGKILAFDVSDDPDCSVRTLKVMGNSANISEICTCFGKTKFLKIQFYPPIKHRL